MTALHACNLMEDKRNKRDEWKLKKEIMKKKKQKTWKKK